LSSACPSSLAFDLCNPIEGELQLFLAPRIVECPISTSPFHQPSGQNPFEALAEGSVVCEVVHENLGIQDSIRDASVNFCVQPHSRDALLNNEFTHLPVETLLFVFNHLDRKRPVAW
jgi:hypothetical protein